MEKVGRLLRQSLIRDIKEGVENNSATFVVRYGGVSASGLDAFRKDLRGVGARVYTSKNRLAKLALKEMDHDALADTIEGQTAFVWSRADAVAVTKELMKFVKESEGIEVKGGLLEGSVLTQDDVKRLADLPPREVLLSQLLALIVSPVTRLAGALNAKSRDLLSILKQYSEKKGGSNDGG